MAKKIQKKQIESGIFVETKDTYEAPVKDNDFVQKKYVDVKVDTKADKVHTHKWVDITEKPQIKKVDSKYTIEGLNGEIVVPTLPAWVGNTKPTYNWSEIIDKPILNYLPLTGGMITPTEGDYREGIRIGDKDGWSLVLLGAVNAYGTTENSWTVARKPDNSLQINNGGISNNKKKGLNLTANTLTFSDDTKSLLEVSNELVHTDKMFDAPIFRVHTPGVDYISLNSKNNKLNVKDGNDGREGNNFKPVLASGYEINGKTDNEVVLAGGGVTNLDGLKNENVKIGGRNYVLNSKQTLITSTATGITGVFGVSPDLKKILLEQPTTSFVVSCFIKYTNLKSVSPKGRLGFEGVIEYTDGTPQYIYYWLNVSDSDVGKSINGERFYRVITLLPNKTVKDIRISGMFVQISADQAEVSNPKIEIGNKPTDWTPAPEDFDFYKGLIPFSDLETFKNRETGSYSVDVGGNWGAYINFKLSGSTSSLEFFKPDWHPTTRIGVRNSVDTNRFNDDNGEFRYLAWYDDVLRAGVECTQNTTLQKVHQNQTLFVTVPCNIELNTIDDLSSVSFRKVFDSGVVSFSCTGKNIIYTADNQFNGKKGSTAVISRYGNDCYIDIRNV